MDEIIVAGKRYISSKRASAISGYAKDYVGQLIRQGKISGTRVGRAWYVDMDEILRHSGRTEGSNIQQESSNHGLQAASMAIPRLTPALIQSQGLPKTWSAVSYESESVDLFPQKMLRRETKEETSISNENLDVKNADISQNRSILIAEKTNVLNTFAEKHKKHNESNETSSNNIVRISTLPKGAHMSRQEMLVATKSNSVLGGRRRLAVSVALLCVGVVAFSSVVSGLFLSSSLISRDGASEYSATVAFGAEYFVGVVRSFR